MGEEHEVRQPVFCPISPELVALLKRPGGLTSEHPVRMWLDENDVLHMQLLYKETGT